MGVKVISHSDGDVILHAITDSILGALSQRDIGTYFPNNKKNLNRNSVEFLNYALNKMNLNKKMINNIDLMIVSEEPKIKSVIDFINIDAEGLDFKILQLIDFNRYKVKLVSVETQYSPCLSYSAQGFFLFSPRYHRGPLLT